MKNILIMGGLGVALFGGTMVGLLGVQGRLNHEGAKNIPVLNMFFPAPSPGEGEEERDKSPDENGKGQEQDPNGPAPAKGDPGVKVTRKSSAELKAPEGGSGGNGGGHGEAPAGKGEDPHAKPQNFATTPSLPGKKEPERQRSKELEKATRSTRKGYEVGKIFAFEGLDTQLEVEEINRIKQRVAQQEAELKFERERLRKLEQGLEVQKRDVAERIRELGKMRTLISEERKKIQLEKQSNVQLNTLISDGELAAQKQAAKTIETLDTNSAKEIILDLWQRSGGDLGEAPRDPRATIPGRGRARTAEQRRFRKDVLAILSLLSTDKVNEIFIAMNPAARKAILRERLGVRMIGAQPNPTK